MESIASESMGVPPCDVVRFLRDVAADGPGLHCMRWLPAAAEGAEGSFVDARLTVAQDCVELQPADSKQRMMCLPLDHLLSAKTACEADAVLPSGVGAAWAEFVVLLEFLETCGDMAPRTECVLLESDAEAALLCRSVIHLQRFGSGCQLAPKKRPGEELPALVAARARTVFATLGSDDVAEALRQWREGAASVNSVAIRTYSRGAAGWPSSGSSLATMWRDAANGMWEVLASPMGHPWGLGAKPEPSLACGWDVPQPHGPMGAYMDPLAAEAELSERWRKLISGRRPSELSQGELRAAFALGDRIPWQYRLALWPVWLGVGDAGSARDFGLKAWRYSLNKGNETADEVHRRQIEKDVRRTRPSDLSETQREELRRVLLGYAALAPSVGYCQGMNFVVALELLVGFTEEQALGGLNSLVEKYCEGYYEESMSGLLRDVAVLDSLLLMMLPSVHARFDEIALPLIWIAAEPLLTLFSKAMAPVESVCRLWDFFLFEGPCAPFAIFLAYAQLAHERNLLQAPTAEDALGAFTLLLGDAGAIASGLLRRASVFLAPRPLGAGLSPELLKGLRDEVAPPVSPKKASI